MSERIENLAKGVSLYLGDCREIVPSLSRDLAVVSDVPYGMKRHGRYQRGPASTSVTPQKSRTRNFGEKVEGDSAPFDPTFLLEFSHVVLWGCNHFGGRLPVGTNLIWIKRSDKGFGTYLSDAEIAWVKGGCGVYCKRDMSLQGVHHRDHPTQKPVSLMEWCFDFCEGATSILDPYMGSGTTGVAAAKRGLGFIGIEKVPKYFEASIRRISEALAKPDIFALSRQPPPSSDGDSRG